jgi:hypothetical protein
MNTAVRRDIDDRVVAHGLEHEKQRLQRRGIDPEGAFLHFILEELVGGGNEVQHVHAIGCFIREERIAVFGAVLAQLHLQVPDAGGYNYRQLACGLPSELVGNECHRKQAEAQNPDDEVGRDDDILKGLRTRPVDEVRVVPEQPGQAVQQDGKAADDIQLVDVLVPVRTAQCTQPSARTALLRKPTDSARSTGLAVISCEPPRHGAAGWWDR